MDVQPRVMSATGRCLKALTFRNLEQINSKSQAVARIADRTASQHLWGYVTIW